MNFPLRVSRSKDMDGEQGLGSRDGAVVRALASNQCGLGSIPGLGVICGLSIVVGSRP